MRPDARPDPCHQGVHGPPANGTEASLWRAKRPGRLWGAGARAVGGARGACSASVAKGGARGSVEPLGSLDACRRSRLMRRITATAPRRREGPGPAGLSSAELIALVWGTGAPGVSALDLATEALAVHGGLAGLAAASRVELEAIPGIGAARAARLGGGFA